MNPIYSNEANIYNTPQMKQRKNNENKLIEDENIYNSIRGNHHRSAMDNHNREIPLKSRHNHNNSALLPLVQEKRKYSNQIQEKHLS